MLGRLASLSWDQLRRAGVKAERVEHVAREWVDGKVARQVGRLPVPVQKAVKGAWLAVRLGTRTAFATYTAGQAAAEAVAKARGATAEEAARFRQVLSAVDVATFKPVALTLGASGLGAAVLPASFVPIGSLTYLAYSTAKDPYATIRAARGAVRRAVSAASGSREFDPRDPRLNELLDAIRAHGADDWHMACLFAALDATQDVGQALGVADRASRSDVKGIKCRYGVNAGKPGPCPEGNTDRPGSATAPAAPAQEADPAEGRPSLPKERHNVSPPALPMKLPPEPKGLSAVGKAGGLSATGKTNTEVGDHAEELAAVLGLRSILPKLASGKERRQNPLDREYDHSGWAFEIKACSTLAQSYKASPKPAEIEDKLAYVQKHKLKAATMIAVYDHESKHVSYYWRPGIGNFRLNPRSQNSMADWNYMGTVGFDGKVKGVLGNYFFRVKGEL